MRDIILASQSKPRKELFSSLGIPFKTIPADINEKAIRDTNLKLRARKIAKAKSQVLLKKYPDSIIIAADTFSEIDGEALEKPNDLKEAVEMLKKVSGKSAKNYTGFCYIDRKNNISVSATIVTKYSFRELYDKEVKSYVKRFPVLTWAAAFGLVHPYIITFVSRVNGSYTGLAYGLPMEKLIPLLKQSGFEPQP